MSGENTNSHLTDSSMIDLTDVDGTHTTGRVMGSVDSDADGKTDTYSVDTDGFCIGFYSRTLGIRVGGRIC